VIDLAQDTHVSVILPLYNIHSWTTWLIISHMQIFTQI